ncbi:hypothetical protein OC71_01245 [Pseudomonas sp. W15Feb9B]|nr:hypothetical protein OC71_01245 [Pseudomonas sp. W15Feb9B]
MVEHPGMWDETRALFRVGTVVGVVRKMAETASVRGKHRARQRLGKRLDYRKGANDQTRAKDRSGLTSIDLPVARELAPAGLRSDPNTFTAAARPSGSKLPRQKSA